MKTDIIIPIKTSLVPLVIEKTIPAILSYVPHRKIYVITRNDNFSTLSNAFSQKIELLDEDKIIEGLTLKKVQEYLEQKKANPKRAGWYFQQFLKLGIAQLDTISNQYLIWDADCVALRKLPPFMQENTVFCDTTDEYNKPYFDTIENLIGIKRQVNYSFISEHFVFDKKIVLTLLNEISKDIKPNWWVDILDKVNPKELSLSGFSEYELYGNYLAKYYPNSFAVRNLKKTRNGVYLLGQKPSRLGMALFSLFFDCISFEECQEKCKPFPVRYKKIVETIFNTLFNVNSK